MRTDYANLGVARKREAEIEQIGRALPLLHLSGCVFYGHAALYAVLAHAAQLAHIEAELIADSLKRCPTVAGVAGFQVRGDNAARHVFDEHGVLCPLCLHVSKFSRYWDGRKRPGPSRSRRISYAWHKIISPNFLLVDEPCMWWDTGEYTAVCKPCGAQILVPMDGNPTQERLGALLALMQHKPFWERINKNRRPTRFNPLKGYGPIQDLEAA